jgi:hypothetical protein
MKNNQNLQNLWLVMCLALFIGLSCGEKERVGRPERRNTPDKEYSPRQSPESNKSNTESNKITNMSDSNKSAPVDKSSFYSVLEANLSNRGLKKSDICDENNPVEKRILHEYGALFLTTGATPPPTCMFKSADEVNNFQSKAGLTSENIGGTTIELQPNAMKALLEARQEAKSKGLDITPRDGAEAARRSFDKTLALWKSRFEPACEHWKKKGKLTDEQIKRLKSLPINEQVKEVLDLEQQGLYFNTFFNATILSSVAAPGTSPHLSMFAFDANEFQNPEVRKIMGNHGWFRTIKGDEPHFTFLGVKEEELKNMGLQKIDTPKGEFWVPNV